MHRPVTEARSRSLSTTPTPDGTREWAVVAARAADEKSGVDTVVLDVGELLAVTDLFVITNGTNPRQVKAIVDEVEKRVAEAGGPRPLRVEGLDTLEWVLLDYGAFVVHVFGAEQRAFYRLERLWGDCPRVEWAASATR
ncbi:MAG TPA: ribosome silencing factor [Acidimicrobiales bacterium]